MQRRTFLSSLAAVPSLAAPPFQAKRGVHPRLLLDAAGFTRLKAAIRTTHAELWDSVRKYADGIASQQPPSYEEQFARRGESDQEQLWQREVGNKMPYLAMAWRLTGDAKYLRAGKEWALAASAYPNWGMPSQYAGGLSAGHQLFGLAILYDWMYEGLDTGTRATLGQRLARRCEDACRGIPLRRKPLLQNHLWVPATGLAAGALAIFDEPGAAPHVERWLDYVIGKYEGTEAALGSDGASHEGVGYWSYGVEYLLKYWHLASEMLGRKPWSPWWRNTAAYFLYHSLPRNAWTRDNNIVDIADSPRTAWYGPDYLLRRLAALYKDPQAQWLARELNREGHHASSGDWLNLVWYDPSVRAEPPAGLPALRHFKDLDIVSARSGWSGDESLVVFKCGPPAGHEASPKFDRDPGVGHVHPDAAHFVVVGAGEWLVRDDGYLAKMTGHHSTLLIDGRGQLGEGGEWFNTKDWYPLPDALPKVLRAVSTPECDEIVGEAAPAYPRDLGVRRFLRRLYFLKPDVLVVVDEVILDAARKLEMRFHPEFAGEKEADGAWLCRGKKSVLRIDPLTPEGAAIEAGEIDLRGMRGRGAAIRRFVFRMSTQAARWRNAVALSWCPASGTPARVALEASGELWVFRAGGRKAYVNHDLRVV